MTSYIPEGYQSITPYLVMKDAAKAIEFYKSALGATEMLRIPGEGGLIGHAELKIDGSVIMLADENPAMGHRGPQTLGGSPIGLMLYVKDVDATVAKAAAAGATITRPVADQFYGDRMGGITDPSGHIWYIATHKEDIAPEELARRASNVGQAS
jgi:PhnB protein